MLAPLLLSALLSVLAVGVAVVGRPAPEPSPAPDRTAALVALREWDARRAAAWRHGDPGALQDLYVAGSVSGRADRALLRAYAARGLRVPDLAVQRASVRVEAAAADEVVLVVTDRVVATAARTVGGRRLALPRDGWSTRRLQLRRVAGEWRVVEVSDLAGPARRPAPR